MQNAGVAIMILLSVLKSPDSDLALIAPVAALLMAGIPLYIITPIYMLRQKFCLNKTVCKTTSRSLKCLNEFTNSYNVSLITT